MVLTILQLLFLVPLSLGLRPGMERGHQFRLLDIVAASGSNYAGIFCEIGGEELPNPEAAAHLRILDCGCLSRVRVSYARSG